MQVNRSMGSQNDHAINETDDKKLPSKILDHEDDEKRREKKNGQPAKKSQPIFTRFKNVQA
jgi:hypothetical protein